MPRNLLACCRSGQRRDCARRRKFRYGRVFHGVRRLHSYWCAYRPADSYQRVRSMSADNWSYNYRNATRPANYQSR